MTTDAVGGVWSYAQELAGAVDAEVTLAVVGPQAPPGLPSHAGRLEWQEDPWEDVDAAGEWLQALVYERRPDVVHLNQYAFGALELPCPKVVVAHSCVLSWHEAVRGGRAGREWSRYRERVTAGLLGADLVIAPTAAMARSLERNYGVKAQVVHNGIAPGPPALPEREPLVLGAGRLWDEAKGLDALDTAAAFSRWPVEVAGESGGAKARHAHLLGALERDALRERMRRAAIFAHPARYEPFGLAVLEAAQAGCALVLGNIPSLRELWDGAALFVPPGDAQGLSVAVDLLARDGELRRHLAAAAREVAAERTAERMARRYDALYRGLVRQAVAA